MALKTKRNFRVFKVDFPNKISHHYVSTSSDVMFFRHQARWPLTNRYVLY